MKRFAAVVLGLVAVPLVAQAEVVKTETRTMDFETCLGVIRSTAGQLGVAPINIVETSDMRVVRFVTSDGSVLVTCSRPDRKMVLTQSR